LRFEILNCSRALVRAILRAFELQQREDGLRPVRRPDAGTMISVVTVVRNGAATIVNCLESVRQQTTPAEHIVIDGQSTDGTLDLLREGQSSSPYLTFISEADKGLYDAMSKGIFRAKGDIVGQLNSDDFYASDRVLEWVVQAFADPTVESCYGDLLYVRRTGAGEPRARIENAEGEFRLSDERVVRRWRAGSGSPRAFYWGWMPPHPTFFVRRSVYERHGMFRLDLGTAADYELMLRLLLKHRITTCYIPQVLVKMMLGGVSNSSVRNRLRANRNDRRSWAVNGLKPYPWTLLMKPLRKLSQWFK
jgi:glycosyltransferase